MNLTHLTVIGSCIQVEAVRYKSLWYLCAKTPCREPPITVIKLQNRGVWAAAETYHAKYLQKQPSNTQNQIQKWYQ
jgi:peptide methionine sulfoxide reductase MsrA